MRVYVVFVGIFGARELSKDSLPRPKLKNVAACIAYYFYTMIHVCMYLQFASVVRRRGPVYDMHTCEMFVYYFFYYIIIHVLYTDMYVHYQLPGT